MEIIGISTDQKQVVQHIGKLYFEQGLPLTFIFDKLQENNLLPSWNHLYIEMINNGMTHDRIIHLLHEQVFESYGKEFRDIVISRLVGLKSFQ